MSALWPWIEQASRRFAHRNMIAIALANKLAGIAWALLARPRPRAKDRPDVSAAPTMAAYPGVELRPR
jgi:hypothetical protein